MQKLICKLPKLFANCELRTANLNPVHHKTISDQKLFSSSLLLAPCFLYTNICLNKIYYAD